MKRWLCLALCMVSLLWGCQSAPEASDTSMLATTVQTSIPDDRPVVGVCLPQKDGIWADRVSFWEEAFEPYGYQVQFSFAEGDVIQQIQQVQTLASVAKLLIISPVDSAAITSPSLTCDSNIFSAATCKLSVPLVAVNAILLLSRVALKSKPFPVLVCDAKYANVAPITNTTNIDIVTIINTKLFFFIYDTSL